MNYEEFLEPREQKNNLNMTTQSVTNEEVISNSEESSLTALESSGFSEELDVQKAVVEELAADKAALDDALTTKDAELEGLRKELEKSRADTAEANRVLDLAKIDVSRLQGEVVRLREEVTKLQESISAEQAKATRAQDELAAEKEKQFDQQERNPNALALLDRDIELPDRFPGETRDQVLEALAEARTRAETEGRLRRAQVLEGVLLANEPNGTLAKKREELKKLFSENGNVINGTVIEELKKLGVSHKNGEEYLLVDEILKRAY